jgi:hypothetical protein
MGSGVLECQAVDEDEVLTRLAKVVLVDAEKLRFFLPAI